MYKAIFTLVSITILSVPLFSQIIVKGQVVDSKNGQAISNAKIRIEYLEEKYKGIASVAKSEVNGKFQISLTTKVDIYKIVVIKDGYYRYQNITAIKTGESLIIPIQKKTQGSINPEKEREVKKSVKRAIRKTDRIKNSAENAKKILADKASNENQTYSQNTITKISNELNSSNSRFRKNNI